MGRYRAPWRRITLRIGQRVECSAQGRSAIVRTAAPSPDRIPLHSAKHRALTREESPGDQTGDTARFQFSTLRFLLHSTLARCPLRQRASLRFPLRTATFAVRIGIVSAVGTARNAEGPHPIGISRRQMEGRPPTRRNKSHRMQICEVCGPSQDIENRP